MAIPVTTDNQSIQRGFMILAGWELLSYTRITRQVVYSLNFWIPIRKELSMFNINNRDYISVGIDVGSTFSFMSIVDSNGNIILKPFKILHNSIDSLERTISAIKKAEESYSMKSRIFLESTGIYHFPLFCFLNESGFEAHIINPLITYSIKNSGIRKVKNDKLDSISIARLGLSNNLKTSVLPFKLVLELRSLVRKYYDIMDQRSAHINRLKADLHTVFPQYLDIFSDVCGSTSRMILKNYGTPDKILRAHKSSLIEKISKSSRRGVSKSTECYEKLLNAATSAKTFGCNIDSVYFNISITIDLIEYLDTIIESILNQIKLLADEHKSEKFIKQVHLLDSISGIGFLSAVTLMCEIGDFNAFNTPKQLFAYFGMDPGVNQSGKFNATEMHMSKRGSRIARRVIFSIALSNIRSTGNGKAINPYLQAYYRKKAESKPKKVAIGAVMHKICNIIFAVLRDEKTFELRSPETHIINYRQSSQLLVA